MYKNNRDELFQKQLDKFPAFLHVDGEKRRIGYLVYYFLMVGFLSTTVIEVAFKSHGDAWAIWREIYNEVVFCGWLVPFNFYAIRHKYNSWLFFGFGYIFLCLIRNTVFARGWDVDLWIVNMVLSLMVLSAWMVLISFIRTKAMDAACREFAMQLRVEEARTKVDFFKIRRKEEKAQEVADENVFIDDQPNWNSKVVMKQSTKFCPKCGFGIVPGEKVCHVCGTSATASEGVPQLMYGTPGCM